MNSVKNILLKLLICFVLILMIPFLLVIGIIYFLTKGIQLVKSQMERV